MFINELTKIICSNSIEEQNFINYCKSHSNFNLNLLNNKIKLFNKHYIVCGMSSNFNWIYLKPTKNNKQSNIIKIPTNLLITHLIQ